MLCFREDRKANDGSIKRVRTTTTLAPYSHYPYKGTESDLSKLREIFHDKIATTLAQLNKENPTVKTSFTLGESIDQSYFPGLEWRLKVPARNELHMEPSTVKGCNDIWKVHVKDHPISKIRLSNFTTRDGQQFLESLP